MKNKYINENRIQAVFAVQSNTCDICDDLTECLNKPRSYLNLLLCCATE